jgi:hypothetical protein
MTYVIPADSPRAATALAFGRELQKACLARDVSLKELERILGIGHTTLWHYRFGQTLPKLATAASLATALEWPKLRELVVRARARTCKRNGCEATFVNDVGSEAKKYCSPACWRIAVNVRQAEVRARSAGQTGSFQTKRAHVQRLRAAVRIADARAGQLHDAIGEMCRGCEPEGLCRTADCPLRDFSPLPLATRPDATPSTVAVNRRRRWTPALRAQQVASNNRRWARPGEREAQSARTLAMHAAMSPEERDAWRAKVGLAQMGSERRRAIATKGAATKRARKAS